MIDIIYLFKNKKKTNENYRPPGHLPPPTPPNRHPTDLPTTPEDIARLYFPEKR
jgi:hypothetical protein